MGRGGAFGASAGWYRPAACGEGVCPCPRSGESSCSLYPLSAWLRRQGLPQEAGKGSHPALAPATAMSSQCSRAEPGPPQGLSSPPHKQHQGSTYFSSASPHPRPGAKRFASVILASPTPGEVGTVTWFCW